ncbi:hypothetical protein [Streptomyces rimosus]
MSAQPVHHGEGGPLPLYQNAVAAAVPPADRRGFYRDMGETDETALSGVLPLVAAGPPVRRPAAVRHPYGHRGGHCARPVRRRHAAPGRRRPRDEHQ